MRKILTYRVSLLQAKDNLQYLYLFIYEDTKSGEISDFGSVQIRVTEC